MHDELEKLIKTSKPESQSVCIGLFLLQKQFFTIKGKTVMSTFVPHIAYKI